MLQAGWSRVQVPMRWIFFKLTEVDSTSNRNEYHVSLKIKKSGGKVWPASRADNLAAIY
jgi:hypothetical protein